MDAYLTFLARKRIDSITDAERARFPEWAARWIKVGLSTERADRAKFEAAARECYRHAGLAEPKAIVWVPSPIVMAFAGPLAALEITRIRKEPRSGNAVDIAVSGAVRVAVSDTVDVAVGNAMGVEVHDVVGVAVGDAVSDMVSDMVGGAVRDAMDIAVSGAVRVAVSGAVSDMVSDMVGGAVRDAMGVEVSGAVGVAVSGAVRGAVSGAVRDAVGGAVGDAVDGAVGDAVGVTVGDAMCDAVHGAVGGAVSRAVLGAARGAVGDMVECVRSQWTHYLGGQFWVGWWYGPATVSFLREVMGLDLGPDMEARADAYRATCESACMWWPHKDFVMVCERPSEIHRDTEGRLHNPSGQSIAWDGDGWGLYSWHGITVPAEWIENTEEIDPALALTHPNIEQRRCLAEIIGWAKVLDQLESEIIDEDADPMIGTLLEVALPGADGRKSQERFLKVLCATNRTFAIPVPPQMRTAMEANCWTYGLDDGALAALEVRT